MYRDQLILNMLIKIIVLPTNPTNQKNCHQVQQGFIIYIESIKTQILIHIKKRRIYENKKGTVFQYTVSYSIE